MRDLYSGESTSVRHMTTQRGRERLYPLMWNTLFIPSFFYSGAQGTHVGLGEWVRFNEAFSLRLGAAWSHGQAWWSVSWCACRAHRGHLFSPALPDGVLYIQRALMSLHWAHTGSFLSATPQQCNKTHLLSNMWVSRSMPKIWTILSIYIIIAKTFCAFKARSMSEVHSSAGQVLLAWADGWMIDVTLGFHKGSSKGYKDPSNWPKELQYIGLLIWALHQCSRATVFLANFEKNYIMVTMWSIWKIQFIHIK